MNNNELAGDTIEKLGTIAKTSYSRGRYQQTLASLSARARLEYTCNQEYTDPEAEDLLMKLSEVVGHRVDHKGDSGAVLFYDGFGLDTRGLVQIYLKALVQNGYRVIYITAASNAQNQPQVMDILRGGTCRIYHDPGHGFTEKTAWLDGIFDNERFDTAFFYTTPWDVSAVLSFYKLRNQCVRYQINLTDHAFWLGVNAFDYCIEFRNYGAAISRDYRGIEPSRLVCLPYYPIINKNMEFQGFPFDTEGKKVVFSGGTLYKTEDPEKTYFKLVEHIVKNHADAVFMYAGYGKSEELERLGRKYPGQVYHIEERTDLVRILENSYLYLNTYPISGALMLQFAAEAGCVPVTLRRPWDDDASGILMDEETLGETFCDFDAVCTELDKLLTDEAYRDGKRQLLKNQVISEADFNRTLQEIIRIPQKHLIGNITPVDTRLFRESYLETLTQERVTSAVLSRETMVLAKYFPYLVVRRICSKIAGAMRLPR